jgi:hypothetical protein
MGRCKRVCEEEEAENEGGAAGCYFGGLCNASQLINKCMHRHKVEEFEEMRRDAKSDTNCFTGPRAARCPFGLSAALMWAGGAAWVTHTTGVVQPPSAYIDDS